MLCDAGLVLGSFRTLHRRGKVALVDDETCAKGQLRCQSWLTGPACFFNPRHPLRFAVNCFPLSLAWFPSCRLSLVNQHPLRWRITPPIGLDPLVQRANRRSKARSLPARKRTHRPRIPPQLPRLAMTPTKKLPAMTRRRLFQMKTRTRNPCPRASRKRLHMKGSKVEVMTLMQRKNKTTLNTRQAGDCSSSRSLCVFACSARHLYVTLRCVFGIMPRKTQSLTFYL